VAIGGPAAQDDAQNADRGHGVTDDQEAHVDVGDKDGRTKRQHAKAVSAVKVEITGAIQKSALSESAGNDVFLDQQFQGVRDGLQEAVRTHAHGSQAHLKIGQHLALESARCSRDQRETAR
jgi:hypothetical protein